MKLEMLIELIDQSTNNDGDEVQAHSISSINIQPEIVKKSDAKQAIDTAVLNQKSLVIITMKPLKKKDVALAKLMKATKLKAATDAQLQIML